MGEWRRANLINQQASVTVADCATSKLVAVENLVVGYAWAETGCRLDVWNRFSHVPGTPPETPDGWGVPDTGRAGCDVQRIGFRSVATSGPVQTWSPDRLSFQGGWFWAGQLCTRSTVTVQATIAGRTYDGQLAPATVCVGSW